MKKYGELETLLRSEVKKVESVANKFCNRKDCKVTGYSSKRGDYGFYDVVCEICFGGLDRADFDVRLYVYMPDRRRSFAKIRTW